MLYEKTYKAKWLALRKIVTLCMCIAVFMSPDQTQAADQSFRINTVTAGDQDKPAIATLKNGGFVTAFASKQSGTNKIFVRRFKADGSAEGTELAVTMGTSDAEWYPDVAGLNDGGFVVVWLAMVNGDPNIYLQRFNADGTADRGPLAVLNETKDHLTPTVSALSNGGFVVSWTHEQMIPYTFDVSAQQFDADGTRVGAVFKVNTVTEATQHDPTIAAAEDGGYFIFWSTHDENTQQNGIYGQRFDSQGVMLGEQFEVMLGAYNVPTSSSLLDGSVMVAWADTTAEGQWKIAARRYSSDGTPDGAIFDVDLPSEHPLKNAKIVGLSDGGFVIAWQSDQTQSKVYARQFRDNGEPKGSVFVVEDSAGMSQLHPDVSALENAGFIVVWTQLDGDDKDIWAKRFVGEIPYAFSLQAPTQTIYVGDEISLDIVAAGSDVYGIDGQLSIIDTAKFNMVSASYGEFFDPAYRIGLNPSVTEPRWHGALSLKEPASAKTGVGTFATITLKAQAAGSSQLVLNGLFSSRDGQVLLQQSLNYTLTVAAAITISGNVYDYGYFGDVGELSLYIDGQLVDVNSDGSFSIKTGVGIHQIDIVAPGFLAWTKHLDLTLDSVNIDLGPVSLVAGDLNGDNKIDSTDLTMLLGAYGSRKSEGGSYFAAADFNADSVINIQDLSILGGNFGQQVQ